MVNFVIILFKPFSTGTAEKLKNAIVEIPIIPEPLNVDNKWTTIGKSINLNIIRKLIKSSLKVVLKGDVCSHSLGDIVA